MDKIEFDAWMAETRRSIRNWRMDDLRYENDGEILAYKGGARGVFILAEADGTVEIGDYDGAIPHIGEAFYTVKHRRKVGRCADDAFRIVCQRMGTSFLLDVLGFTS